MEGQPTDYAHMASGPHTSEIQVTEDATEIASPTLVVPDGMTEKGRMCLEIVMHNPASPVLSSSELMSTALDAVVAVLIVLDCVRLPTITATGVAGWAAFEFWMYVNAKRQSTKVYTDLDDEPIVPDQSSGVVLGWKRALPHTDLFVPADHGLNDIDEQQIVELLVQVHHGGMTFLTYIHFPLLQPYAGNIFLDMFATFRKEGTVAVSERPKEGKLPMLVKAGVFTKHWRQSPPSIITGDTLAAFAWFCGIRQADDVDGIRFDLMQALRLAVTGHVREAVSSGVGGKRRADSPDPDYPDDYLEKRTGAAYMQKRMDMLNEQLAERRAEEIAAGVAGRLAGGPAGGTL